jgi:hypothetical protein
MSKIESIDIQEELRKLREEEITFVNSGLI